MADEDLDALAAEYALGTLSAVGVGYVIYMGLPLLLAARASTQALIERKSRIF